MTDEEQNCNLNSQKQKAKEKDILNGMQSSREQQGEIEELLQLTLQRNRGKQQNGEAKIIGDIKGTFHGRMGKIKDRN